jgi:hypothetical protein
MSDIIDNSELEIHLTVFKIQLQHWRKHTTLPLQRKTKDINEMCGINKVKLIPPFLHKDCIEYRPCYGGVRGFSQRCNNCGSWNDGDTGMTNNIHMACYLGICPK